VLGHVKFIKSFSQLLPCRYTIPTLIHARCFMSKSENDLSYQKPTKRETEFAK